MKSNFVRSMLVVAAAFIIQSPLGAIYAWSAFTSALKTAGWTNVQTQLPFTVGLVTFAVVMVYAGRKLHTWGPQKLTVLSATLLGSGYALAGLTGGLSFWPVLIGIGFLGGAGIGLGYVVPIAVGMQWFPDKKGLITGIAVAGFGLGALFWVKLAGSQGQLIAQYGIGNTFILFGIIFFTAVVLGSFFMKFPANYQAPTDIEPAGKHDFRSTDMLKTSQYWSIAATFAVGATAGLMSIGLMKSYPGQALVESGIAEAEAFAIAGTAMAIFAIANAAGRIGWGKISDIIGHAISCDQGGRRHSLVLMSASQGIFMIIFPHAAGDPELLYILAALLGFNFGGNFALFPAITTDTFGHKFFGQNYGYVFLAYGVGGTFGPILGGYLGDMGNFALAFFITGAMSLVAAFVISLVRIPIKDVKGDQKNESRMHVATENS